MFAVHQSKLLLCCQPSSVGELPGCLGGLHAAYARRGLEPLGAHTEHVHIVVRVFEWTCQVLSINRPAINQSAWRLHDSSLETAPSIINCAK